MRSRDLSPARVACARPRRRLGFGGLALAVSLAANVARADAPDPASPSARPIAPVAVDVKDLDLDQIVTSAAKGRTTVQEAPAIITIITAEEIRQRGYRDIGQVLASVPGWIDARGEGDQIELPMVRGQVQAVLYLRDGVSMFDSAYNTPATNRSVPLETIKRIEVVTGPGGVLWGANSYLGIVNIITMDGDDVNGVVASVGYGDGPGNKQDVRAYAMFGRSFLHDKLKVLVHASYESYEGETYSGRQYLVGSPSPQPIGPSVFGLGTVDSDVARSYILDLDGKLSYGPLHLYFQVPFGEMNYAASFGPPYLVMDRGANGMVCAGCDRSTWTVLDRYAVLQYQSRFARGRVGVDAKAYYINFDRTFGLRVLPSSSALPGGLSFQAPSGLDQRYGATLDVDVAAASWNRVLAGAEVFHESVQGDGPGGSLTATFTEPAAQSLLLVCPLDPSDPAHKKVAAGCPIPFLFGGAERTVVGLFVDDQIRPHRTLTLDLGLRYQQGFGALGYTIKNPLFGSIPLIASAAAVWQFRPDYHLKLNFSQGFRPPVFNNTNGNGAAVQFAGNAKLQVESSESYSAEVNARVLRDVNRVRELQLRLDYAYTLLDNTIVVQSGSYVNSGRRAIHSVELLAKLYLAGDHFVSLAYTFQHIDTSDLGAFNSVPHHYAQLGAVFRVIRGLLDVNANLTLLAGTDDPNRVPTSQVTLPGGMPGAAARITDFTFDHLPPAAVLQVGVRVHLWKDRLVLSAQAYNALNQSYYYPDVFSDLTPIVENRPNPAPRWSIFSSATLRL